MTKPNPEPKVILTPGTPFARAALAHLRDLCRAEGLDREADEWELERRRFVAWKTEGPERTLRNSDSLESNRTRCIVRISADGRFLESESPDGSAELERREGV